MADPDAGHCRLTLPALLLPLAPVSWHNLPSRLRALSPAASWHGDELVLPGPASARPAMLDVIREAGGEIRGLTAEEGHLDQFYRELIGEQP